MRGQRTRRSVGVGGTRSMMCRWATAVQRSATPATFVAATSLLAADKPTRVSGGGGFPLTPSVTSMYGAVDELVTPGKKPLTFMIYFRGKQGWHDREWKVDERWHSNPFLIEFAS